MNKLIQLVGVLIALVAGVVAVVGFIQFQDGRADNGYAMPMVFFGFVGMAVGIMIWMGARAIDWWKRP